MVKTRLLSLAEPVPSEETERGPNNLANLEFRRLNVFERKNEVWNEYLTREFYQ